MADHDAGLVERTLAGDKTAFDELVERYIRRALAVAWEYLERREDAEDVVQDAFLRVLTALPRFDTKRPFAPWFFTIVRNTARDAASRLGRQHFEELPAELVGDTQEHIERELELRTAVAQVLPLVEALPGMQRACFRLADLEGFTAAEGGEMLGVSPSTFRVHLHRARAALRAAMRSDVASGQGATST